MKICAIAIAFTLAVFGVVHPASAEDSTASVYMRTKEAGAARSTAAQVLIASARRGGSVSVIVTLDQAIDAEPDARSETFRKQQSDLFTAQDQLVSRIHFGRKRLEAADRFETVPMLVMEVTEAELNRLMRDPKVVSLELNRKITLKPQCCRKAPSHIG